HGANGQHLGTVAGERDAAPGGGVAHAAAQCYEVKPGRLTPDLAKPNAAVAGLLGVEADHGGSTGCPRLSERTADFPARGRGHYEQVEIGRRGPARLDRQTIRAPGRYVVVHLPGNPLVPSVSAGANRARPVSLGRIAGAGE